TANESPGAGWIAPRASRTPARAAEDITARRATRRSSEAFDAPTGLQSGEKCLAARGSPFGGEGNGSVLHCLDVGRNLDDQSVGATVMNRGSVVCRPLVGGTEDRLFDRAGTCGI